MKYIRGKNSSTKEVDTETFVYNRTSGRMYSFSEVGQSIWLMLASPHTIGQIVQQVTAEFDVGIEEAARDVENFLNELSIKDLLSVYE